MKKKFPLLLFALAVFCLLAAAGQYAGGYLFLRITGLPPEILQFDTLRQYRRHYGHLPQIAAALRYGYAAAAAVVLIPFLTVAAAAAFGRPKHELHGSSRFARPAEISKAGLLPPPKKKAKLAKKIPSKPEILIGKYRGNFLRWFGNEFCFIAAPTRSGKGVGIVIPNCLNYTDSMVVYDPKQENFIKTSGRRRAMGQEVFMFNPSGRGEKEPGENTPMRSHRWNPFSYVSRDPRTMYSDVSNMAQILYPKPAKDSGGNDGFFQQSAQKLFVGLGMYMVETENTRNEPPSLSLLFRLTAPPGYSLQDFIKKYVLGIALNDKEKPLPPAAISDECRTLLNGFATGNEKTSGDILATMTAPLLIFLDPVVQAATSGDDFKLTDLRRKKMTVYIGIQPNDIDRFANLLNLFFSQLVNENVKQGLPENNPSLKYQCLLLIDEFTALGYMPVLEKGVAYIAGYNLRLLLIFQSPAQVARLYTKEGLRTFATNFAAQIVFTPRDQEDAKEYSELIGYQTVKARSSGTSTGKSSSRSQNISDQKRAVMLPDELKQMPPNECIISMNGIYPIHAEKIFYYQEKEFDGMTDIPPVEIAVLKTGGTAGDIHPEIRAAQKKQAGKTREETKNFIQTLLFPDKPGEENAAYSAAVKNLLATISDEMMKTMLQEAAAAETD